MWKAILSNRTKPFKMQYKYTSLKEVIGNVVRNTRVQDASFIADIHEWLYEGMDMMQTKYSLGCFSVPLDITFHKAKLPCGLQWIDGVKYNGQRLKEGGNFSHRMNNNPMEVIGFESRVGKITSQGHTLYATDVTALYGLGCGSDRYFTEMGYMNTSFSSGHVELYYSGIITDEDGFPQIPDNQNYKQALYWYCRAMMIGAGWEDKQFTYEKCFAQWEQLYAPRAIAELLMPGPEQMEHRVDTFTRFIPDQNYYDNFFQSSGREGQFDLNRGAFYM